MPRFLKRNYYWLCFIFNLGQLVAQDHLLSKNLFINADIQTSIDYWNIQNPDFKFHSSFKPYLSKTISDSADLTVPFNHYLIRNYFLSKTLDDKPQRINHYNFQFHPIIHSSLGYDLLNNKIVGEAIGGAHAKVNINDDFTLAGTVFAGSSVLPFYHDSILGESKLLPGLGRVYGSNNKGYQIFDYNGYVSYSPKNNKVFNFQLGRDRHFIGDGYRSVLLSDFANPYPYFRINTNIWRIQYNAWYTLMNDVTNANGIKKNFQNKFATFHYLSWNITKNLNVGVFENVVWRGSDTNQVRSFDVNYLNPIIFFRPQEYAVGSPDNSFIGLNISLKIARTIKLYGQLGLDEFFLKEIRARRGWWANKQAWQLGFNYINAFKVKGLNVQLEYNEVRPYTYTHGLIAQNYAHNGFALAHPMGANFREFVGLINYRKSNYQFSAKGIAVNVGKDTIGSNSNIGQNIFKSYVTRPYEFGHKTTQGDKHTVLHGEIKFTYWVLPNINGRLEIGYIQRSVVSSAGYKLENPFVFIGIKTSFWNIYNDY